MTQDKTTTQPAKRRGFGIFRKLIPLLVVGAAAMGVWALATFLPKRNDDRPPSPLPPVPVKVQVIQPIAEVEDAFRIPGVVEANNVVDVAAEVAAQVEAYAGLEDRVDELGQPIKGPASAGVLDEGFPVRADQPLVYLNTDLLLAERDRAKAECEFQHREWDRIQDSFEKGVATKMEVDQTGMKRDVAKAALELAEANLRRATIVAPISGILNRLPAEIGEYVSPGSEIAQIVELDKVKVVLNVPEKDVGYLHVGDEETILCGIDSPEKIRGRITYISELADPDTRTTRIEITVENPPDPDGRRAMRSGQIVQASLRRQTLKNVIMIPLRAVIPLEEGYIVYLDQNGKAQSRRIQLSSFFQGQTVRVLSGLQAGDRLIVESQRLLGPGQAVRAIASAASPPASASAPTDGGAASGE